MTRLPYLDADAILGLLPMADAIAVIEAALRAGIDASSGPARTHTTVSAGELLVMPAESPDGVGVKLVTIAPDNAARGRPLVQATYVLHDAATLTPVAVLDGTALTALRTPAVSAVAVRHLAPPDATRLLVFGTGVQAWGHVEAVLAVRDVTDVTVVGRDPTRTAAFAEHVSDLGVDARVGSADDVSTADLIVCATTATQPLFDSSRLGDGACVVAIGTYQPDRPEVDGTLVGRADRVVVEDRATALREAGDIVLAIAEGHLVADDLLDLADLAASDPVPAPSAPSLFKGVGMAWQDLVVAAAIHDRHARR